MVLTLDNNVEVNSGLQIDVISAVDITAETITADVAQSSSGYSGHTISATYLSVTRDAAIGSADVDSGLAADTVSARVTDAQDATAQRQVVDSTLDAERVIAGTAQVGTATADLVETSSGLTGDTVSATNVEATNIDADDADVNSGVTADTVSASSVDASTVSANDADVSSTATVETLTASDVGTDTETVNSTLTAEDVTAASVTADNGDVNSSLTAEDVTAGTATADDANVNSTATVESLTAATATGDDVNANSTLTAEDASVGVLTLAGNNVDPDGDGAVEETAYNRQGTLDSTVVTTTRQIVGADTTSQAITVTLQSGLASDGEWVMVKDEGGQAGNSGYEATVVTEDASLIDGTSQVLLDAAYESVEVYSDGSDWYTH